MTDSSRSESPLLQNNIVRPLNVVMDTVDVCSETDEELIRSTKRQRENVSEEEEGWTEVRGKKSRRNSCSSVKEDKCEVYISSKDRIPKQIALARTLKENEITKICQVKYLNPFKLRLQFENADAAKKLFECEKLLKKGWKFQKAMEVSISYGIIKDVDLDLNDDEILNNISCPPPAKLVSYMRLNRRNRDKGGRCPSESIRLSFSGDCIPEFIRVCDISVRVLPYIHQVSQCSQCWKLGHVRKACPGKTIICPKCSGHHENCDAKSFRCVNCGGDHISMSKACPIYKKERKLREIMAEMRCTYRKALEYYTPPENYVHPQAPLDTDARDQFPPLHQNNASRNKIILSTPDTLPRATYAETTQAAINIHNVEVHDTKSSRQSIKTDSKPKPKKRAADKDWMFWNYDVDNKGDNCDHISEDESNKNEQSPPFSELLSRLKEVIFLRQASVTSKINSVIQLCIEWLMLVSVSYISEWPWIKKMFSFTSYDHCNV